MNVHEVMYWALEHFYHADKANAAIHTSQTRFSPLTFRLAEALEPYLPDSFIVQEVLSHRGKYAEDKGRT
jgi:hypothetical protein